MPYWIISQAYSCQIESVSPSSTVRVTSFNCGMLQIWTWFLCHCYTGLLDSCGYSKMLSSPWWLVSVGAKPGWYSITTLIITVSFLQLSHEAGSCKLERECRDRPSEVKGVLSELESGWLDMSVSHLSRSLWPIWCHCAEFSLFPLSVAGAMARGRSLMLVWMTISHTHRALSLQAWSGEKCIYIYF
jgi:hypothetical protein